MWCLFLGLEETSTLEKMNNLRRNEMLETRKAVLQEFYTFLETSAIDNDCIDFFRLLKDKVTGLPLRGYFIQKIYDYLQHQYPDAGDLTSKKLFPGTLPFVIETVISIQYYHNQILDGKAGVTHIRKIHDNMIVGNLLKEHLYEYIHQKMDQATAKVVERYIRQMFKYTDIGQYIEKNFTTYAQYLVHGDSTRTPFEGELSKFLDAEVLDFIMRLSNHAQEENESNAPFLRLYFQKIYLICATLFKLSARLIVELMGIDPEKEKLAKFATYHGMMRQLVNDNCDWTPSEFNHSTVAKTPEDAFSDLRNKNVTYPLFLYLQRHNGVIKDYLEGKESGFCVGEQRLYFEKIIESGSMKASMDLAKRIGKYGLSFLEENNPHKWFFVDISRIAEFNKYYYHFIQYDKKSSNCYG